MVEEKRRYIRWETKTRVAYALNKDDDLYKEVFTADISEKGLQILTNVKLELEQILYLKLEFMSDSVPVVAEGKVVYLKIEEGKYRVGLEFTKMDDFQMQRLKRCLEDIRKEFEREAKKRYG